MKLNIRPAIPDDDSFLAWAMLEASRSHIGRGPWDLVINGTEEQCLTILKLSATTERPHLFHYSHFWVMEADGRPASALEGFNSEGSGFEEYNKEFFKIVKKLGWSEAEAKAAIDRAAPCRTCEFETVPQSWVVESVATRPEFRRQGLIDRLLESILDQGRKRGFKRSQVDFFIGNTPAQRAYEKHGFRLIDEKRHPDFEKAIGSPGIARLMREL